MASVTSNYVYTPNGNWYSPDSAGGGPNPLMPQVQTYKKSVAFGVLGQSNERGNGYDVSGTVPLWFVGGTTGLTDPIAPALSRAASMWVPFAEIMRSRGYQVQVVNCGLGSLSFVRHTAGQSVNRGSAGQGANSNQYYRARTTSGGSDPGDYGSVTVNSGRVFEATTGRGRWVYYNNTASPLTISGATGSPFGVLDYYKEESTAPTSGSSDPNWASAVSVGDTVADGGITWKLAATSSTGMPGNTGILADGNLGFDPMGVCARLHTAMSALSADQKWILISNGQADTWTYNTGINSTYKGWYQTALGNIVQYFLNRGYKVAVGFTCYESTADTRVYDLLQQAKNGVLTTYAANANVIAGADLYSYFGTNPPLYPEGGVPANGYVHLTDEGLRKAAVAWANAFQSVLT